MKKILLSGIFVTLAFFSATAQNVSIPDPIFKNFLVNHQYNTNPMGIGTDVFLDSNHDGEIQYTEAASYTSNIFNHGFYLNGGLNITNLTGIEAFKSIEYLNIDGNLLTNLDISGCTSLKVLSCNNNLFNVLNLSSPALESIDCNNNALLTSLNLSGCPVLKKITVQINPNLTTMNINGCGFLEELKVNQNAQLTSLMMGTHYQLTLFQGRDNQLSTLDVSGCHSLRYLFCTGNQLTSLNLANGNPQSFTQIAANGYPNLTCIKVNNVAVSEFLWAGTYPYEFDEWASFSTDCTPSGPCVVTIPDALFKTRLTANPAINTNGNDQIECTEAEAYTGIINVDNANISNMTGIEAFVNISALSCNNIDDWNFTTLNVSGFTALTSLSCTGNSQFKSLNVSGCTALRNFSADTGNSGIDLDVNASGCTALTGFNVVCWTNLSLNLNGCTALTSLDLDSENLKMLDVSNCSALTNLICSNNKLNALPLDGCAALKTLNCSNNNISSLAVNGNLPLTDLNCSNNLLTALSVLDNVNLTTLNCSNNELPYIIVSNNNALTQLNCGNNNIRYLDLNNNLNLTFLDCSNNLLSTQNVSLNTALAYLNCSHNNIGSLNMSSNAALTTVYCENNNLSTLNTSNNPLLRILSCSNNQLAQLDLINNPVLWQLDCNQNQLTRLDFSANPSLYQLNCTQNELSTLDVSNTNCQQLVCNNNDSLQSLNFANGRNTTGFIIFLANNNPLLECIQVDDSAFSTANWTNSEYFSFDSTVNFSEDCSLGTEQTANHQAFTIYPNPTNGIVHFSKETNVKLYNVTGQIISDRQNVNTLDLSNQSPGIYFITFSDQKGSILQTSKIVKH